MRRLNDRGAVIDVSQLPPRGVMQTLELSRAPVIASHSAVQARGMLDDAQRLQADARAEIWSRNFLRVERAAEAAAAR